MLPKEVPKAKNLLPVPEMHVGIPTPETSFVLNNLETFFKLV